MEVGRLHEALAKEGRKRAAALEAAAAAEQRASDAQSSSSRVPSASVKLPACVRLMTYNLDSIVYAPRWAHVGKAARCVELVLAHHVSLLVLQEVADVLSLVILF